VKLPPPRPGLVIRYAFLWSHEARKGAVEAVKERPCAIVVAARKGTNGDVRVIVAPITHQPPADPTASIAVPPEVCRKLGLDSDAQWLRIDELNGFLWPGYDLRPLPGRDTVEYGLLPEALFRDLRMRILERQQSRQSGRPINRD